MVNEREEAYDGEEGEYHFSDEGNYEIEPDAPKAAATPAKSAKELLTQLTPRRKMIVAGVIFIVLIGIVYKTLVPTTSAPATEFSQATPEKVVKTTTTSTASSKHMTTTAHPQTASPTQPVQHPVTAQVNQSTPAMMTPPPIPTVANNPPPMVTQPAMIQSAPPIPTTAPIVAEVPAPPTAIQPAPPMTAVNTPYLQQQTSTEMPAKELNNRMTSLEEQNAAVMNLLQKEYAQKMADYESQVIASRGKMEELTKRLNRIETSLNQMTQLLEGVSKSPQSANLAEPRLAAPRASAPKMAYSVQAIIPGRAWLKSESGDTVTVAEGDILKNYGRITKIDPYDGVVDIDTGNKVITLSYGMSVD